ncbi:MAG: MFS transporter [Thermodesulfovibrionales bacterium]|nr:MFS transporter [Thermodesulfovibrionales bacterium]
MKNLDKKRIFSWCLFDFANSSYSAVISSVIFPVYYVTVIVGDSPGLGELWWGRAISSSMLIVALLSPLLGGIADYSGLRKRSLFISVALCITAVAVLSTLKSGDILKGFFLILVANVAMESAVVFYNSFLPLISPKEYLGRVSSWGYAIGYLGSIISLLIGLYLVQRGHYDLTWISVSLFFFIFSIPLFINMPADERKERFFHSARKGMNYILRTFRELWTESALRRFLIAYFLYIDGINTVITFSGIYAAVTLGFEQKELIILYIVVQITALIGAFLFARAVDSWGPRDVILISLVLWITVSVGAFFVATRSGFFVLASIAGIGLGTVQASSRALFSRFVPREKESEYFGVYSMVGKSSAILGPLLFGEISGLTGSQRPAILTVTIFFIAGFLLMLGIRKR